MAGGFPLRTRDTVVNFVEPGPISWQDWLEEGPVNLAPVTRQMGADVTYRLGRGLRFGPI